MRPMIHSNLGSTLTLSIKCRAGSILFGAFNSHESKERRRLVRILRYLKNSKVAVVLIVALLIVQAFADLSLPRYTSDLVDVGIQQSGIEHASPDQMRASTFEATCMLASEEGENLIRASYAPSDDGTYALTDEGSKQREALDDAMAWPMAIVYFADQASEESARASGGAEGGDAAASSGEESASVDGAFMRDGFDLAQLVQAYQAGAISKDDVLSMVDSAKEHLSGVSDSLVDQQAIAAVKAEYEALGLDMGAIQMGCLLRIGAQMLGVAALMAIVSVAVGFLASRTAAKVARGLRERLFSKVLSFSDAEVQRFSAASLITRGTNDIQQIQMVLTMVLRMVLYAPILAIGGIIMVSRTNASMSWIIVFAVVVIFLIIGILMAIALPKFKVMQKLIDRVNLVAREMLNGLPVIRAFGRQDFEYKRFDDASTALYRTQLFTNRAMTFMMPAMMLVMNGVSVLIVWVGGSYIDSGTIQTGDMIAFITYSMVIIMSFLIIGMMAIMLPRADVAAERVNEVLSTESSIHDPARPVELPASGAAGERRGARIEFKDVTFAYDEGSEPVLRHISFVAEPGDTLAIIGPTGCGKSTVLKLIERFYDVSEGAVLIDGVDVRSLRQHDLRSLLGYVPQKAFLFSGSIADTVRFGAPGASDDDVSAALEIAQAADFVGEKEEGAESFVSQGGDNVSGGQRQRLSIARAIATNARAYLFDDSFSALDYATDARLRAALASKLGDATKVIVAQRISTVLDATTIVVLDDGEMVGRGTHAQLLRTCPTYREIAESQLSPAEIERTLSQGDGAVRCDNAACEEGAAQEKSAAQGGDAQKGGGVR